MPVLGHNNFQTNISSQSLFLQRHGENFRSPLEMRGSKSSDDEKANKMADDVLDKIFQNEEAHQIIDKSLERITENDKNGEKNILKTIAQQKEQDARDIARIHDEIDMLDDDGPHFDDIDVEAAVRAREEFDNDDLEGIEKLGEPSTASFNPNRLSAAEITDIQKHLDQSFETNGQNKNPRPSSKRETAPQPQAIQVTPPKKGFLSGLAQKPWAQGVMRLLGIATLSGALNKEVQARSAENRPAAHSQLAVQASDSLDFKAATDFQFSSASKKETGARREEKMARGIKPPTLRTEPSLTLEPVKIPIKEALAAKGSYEKKPKPEIPSEEIADIHIDTKAARTVQTNIGEKSVKAPPEIANRTPKKMSARESAMAIAPVRKKVKELNLGQKRQKNSEAGSPPIASNTK